MTYPSDFERPPVPTPPPGSLLAIPLSRPFITYILLGINIVVWLLMTLFGDSDLIRFGANSGRHILLEGETWRLFTSMFLHVGLAHLAFNSYALLIFGVEMERIYGPIRFLAVYLLSGLFGSLVSFASKGPFVVSAGASGAIFGIIGMNLAYFYIHRAEFGQLGRQRVTSTVVIIAINLILGFTIPRIDNMAHIGGLVAGLALGYALAPRYQVVDDYASNPRLVDTNSLLKRWWVPLLSLVLLILGVEAAIAFWMRQLGGL